MSVPKFPTAWNFFFHAERIDYYVKMSMYASTLVRYKAKVVVRSSISSGCNTTGTPWMSRGRIYSDVQCKKPRKHIHTPILDTLHFRYLAAYSLALRYWHRPWIISPLLVLFPNLARRAKHNLTGGSSVSCNEVADHQSNSCPNINAKE